MAKTYAGIDIGASEIKMAVCSNGIIKRAAVFPLPENMINKGEIASYEEIVPYLKSGRRKGHVRTKDAAVALSLQQAYLKRLTIPKMTAEQLSINLPYEFRDFIPEHKEKYFYDYYLVEEIQEGEDEHLYDIMASAVAKETVENYRILLKRSGFKLRTLLPQEVAYGNLIRAHEKAHPSQEKKDYCIVDLGHEGTRVHLFEGDTFEVTRQIDIGGKDLDAMIAQVKGIDKFMARAYKHSNRDGVQLLPECVSIYSNIAIEIMRAINFYAFNYPNNNLEKIYLCGGGSKIGPLIKQIRENITVELDGISQLMPQCAKNIVDPFLYSVALGVTMQ
ncbi:MAG: hypothetical protein EOM59_05010 [Clostridia bacterium]|nr:hypothetical protein [Clostridia bacterium]